MRPAEHASATAQPGSRRCRQSLNRQLAAAPRDLEVAARDLARWRQRRREIAHARRIDQFPAGRQRVQRSSARRVSPAFTRARDFVDLCLNAGNEPVRQRTLADSGLADENACLACEPRPERVDAIGEPLARAEDRVTNANVVLQGGGERPGHIVQVGFVCDDAGREAIPCGRCEISVAEAEIRRRHRGDDGDELCEVGGDGFGCTPRVDAGEQVCTRQDLDDDVRRQPRCLRVSSARDRRRRLRGGVPAAGNGFAGPHRP